LDVPDALIQKTLMVNTVAHGYTTKAFLPKMIENNRGHVVSIASSAGITGVSGLADYCASKFGAVGFDEALRLEMKKLRKNVKTTCVCPYFIDTGMFEGASTRFSFILPILSAEYAATRIVQAILQEETYLLMPAFVNSIYFMRCFCPTWLYDKLMDWIGASNSMDHFIGRK